METISFKTTAVIIAAVFVACNSNTANNVGDTVKPGEAAEHQHPQSAAGDTAVISADQSVFFGNIKDGQTISSPITIEFGVKGMTVMPLDSGVKANVGHHHLLVDTMAFVQAGTTVPMVDLRIIHYGKGQIKSAPLTLKPGPHVLALQFADGLHRSYGIKMSKQIKVIVK